ncbi:MAG TPA: hypothetical protein VHG72_10380 [Polyangia bacterium]|nr:hypothetical protein [Polyangia bacterium]
MAESIPASSAVGQKLNVLYELTKSIRGALIDQAIWADVLVTDILAEFFVPDQKRRMLLLSDVLTGRDATFSGRCAVLEKVVASFYPAFHKQHAKLFDELSKIRRTRNRLAHAHLDTNDEFLSKDHTDRIQLVFYEDGERKQQVITVEEFQQRLKDGSGTTQVLVELLELIRSEATAVGR